MPIGDMISSAGQGLRGLGQNFQQAGGFEGLLGSPQFQMGVNLMGQAGRYGEPRGLGADLSTAMQQTQQQIAQQQQAAMQKKQAQLQEKMFEQKLGQAEKQMKLEQQRQKAVQRIGEIAETNPQAAYGIAMQSGVPDLEDWAMQQLFPKPDTPHGLEKLYAAEQAGRVPSGTFQRQLEGKPAVNINMGQGGVKYQKIGDQFVPTDAATGAPLGPAVSVEGLAKGSAEGARLSLMRQAGESIDKAKNLIFERDEHGNVKDLNQKVLFGANVPYTQGIGEDSRKFNQSVDTAIEAAVRINTGAAVTAQEMEIYRRMYVPSPLDSKDVAKQKLESLEKFLGGAERQATGQQEVPGLGQQASPQGGLGTVAPPGSVKIEPIPGPSQQMGTTQDNPIPLPSDEAAADEAYDALPSGAYYIDPEGTLRRKR